MIALLLAAAAAATEPRPTDTFTSLFEQACVQHRDSPQALAAQMAQWGARRLPAHEAKRVPGAGDGTVWTLRRENVRHAVILQRDGACAVTAPQVDAKAVQRNFPLLARDSPPTYTARPVEDTATASQEPGTRITYAWSAAGVAGEWRLMLILSGDRNRPGQATALLSRAATP